LKNNNFLLTLAGFLLFSVGALPTVHAYSSGINNFSGNPLAGGGATCSTCHTGGIIPTVTITGPVSVQPATTNTYTLTITGGQQNIGGLDVSVDGGSLVSTQANTRILVGELTHLVPATALADGSVTWSFDWQAPSAPGNYTLYGAGLSADASATFFGDASNSAVLVVNVSAGAPQAPVAVISAPMSAQVAQSVTFDGTGSTDPDGTIVQYDWDFGDGTTGTGAVATHSYGVAGTYTVTLKVTDDTNLSDQTFVDIVVGGAMIPVADPGGPYTGVPGVAITFDASGSTHTSPITRYLWDYGDGSALDITTAPTASHAYAVNGTYTLTLAVQDASFLTGVAATTVTVTTIINPPATGEELYIANCQVCHGVNGSGGSAIAIGGATVSQIDNALLTIGAMGSISLTGSETALIADFLSAFGGGGGGGSTGEELYIANCQACHGVNGGGGSAVGIVGVSANQITNALGTIGAMSFINLTAGEITAIADFLGSFSRPTDGQGLYNMFCASCHGPGGYGGVAEAIRGASLSEILGAISSESAMQSLGGVLNNTELSSIADYLNGGGGGGGGATGQQLYIANCQVCHGVDGTGGSAVAITGVSASQITTALSSIGAMSSISLTAGETDLIAAFLGGGGGGGGGATTGQEIYIANCQACHGVNGAGGSAVGIVGVSASQITNALNSVGAMGAISLTAGEVTAVANFLAGFSRPTDGQGLYDMFCASCHGAGGSGGRAESVRGASYTEILGAITSERDMQGLAGVLNTTEIRSIANYLGGGCSNCGGGG